MVDQNPSDLPVAAYDIDTAASDRKVSIDLRELYAIAYRSRYALIAIISICLLIGIAFTVLTTRLYEGVATVEVRQEAEKVLGTEDDRESASSKIDVERFLDTQLDLVRSRVVLTRVAEELGLFRNPSSFLEAMGEESDLEADSVRTKEEARREAILETLHENVEVEYIGQTRIMTIRFLSPDAELSARIANSFSDNYIRSNLERKSESSSYALDFLRGQLREAQVRLEESERAALEYARRTRIVDASNAASSVGTAENKQPQSLITAQLVQLNGAYSSAVSARVAAEEKWRRTANLPVLNIPDVLSNPAIQGLLEKRAVVESEYREQLETRQGEFPEVRQTAARLAEIDRQITTLARNIRDSVRSQYEVARRQETQLLAQLDTLKSSTLVEQNQTIQLSILRREADTNRQQYESLLRRFNQLNAESGVQANNLVVVDRAVPDPNPAWPNTLLNVILSLALGLIISAVYLLIQNQLFDKVRSSVDVTDRMKQPLLGVIPTVADINEALGDQKSEFNEAFNVVRTSLSLSTGGGVPRTVVLTSVQPSEGKSSSCISLASAFARLGKKVLIIDLDLRRPNVHRLLNLPNKSGASTILSGQSGYADQVRQTEIANLFAITSGPQPPVPTDLLVSDRLNQLLSELRDAFDLVLVDSPPVLALADAGILAGKVDATIFVIESGRNGKRAVETAIGRLKRNGAHVAGVLLTKYDAGEMGYGYNSDYAYVYSYASKHGSKDED